MPTPNDEIKQNPPLYGYINWAELRDITVRGLGQPTLVALVTSVFITIGESAHMWYVGPAGPTVILVLSSVAGYLRSRKLATKYLNEGQ